MLNKFYHLPFQARHKAAPHAQQPVRWLAPGHDARRWCVPRHLWRTRPQFRGELSEPIWCRCFWGWQFLPTGWAGFDTFSKERTQKSGGAEFSGAGKDYAKWRRLRTILRKSLVNWKMARSINIFSQINWN